MKQTTELRLAWRQEFASALLDEIAEEPIRFSARCLIVIFCNQYICKGMVRDFRALEFSIMGFVVKRKLKRRGLKVVIQYLEMLEDCFTDCKICLN